MDDMDRKDEIKNVKNIEELFEKWNDTQTESENTKTTKKAEKRGISKNSFCRDGAIDKECWEKEDSKKRILYILREANGSNATSVEKDGILVGEYKKDKSFWAQTEIKKHKNDLSHLPILLKKLLNVCSIVNEKKKWDFSTENYEPMNKTAFMNINKMGGYSSVNWPMLIAYAEEYRDFIKQEIEILNPDVIVCCGTHWLLTDVVCNGKKEEWDELVGNKKVYDLPHPARRGIRIVDYGEEILSGQKEKEESPDLEKLKKELGGKFKKIIENIKSEDMLREFEETLDNFDEEKE